MITLSLTLPNYLNVSLQVGDMIYARDTLQLPNPINLQGGQTGVDTDATHLVGVLRQINSLGNDLWTLEVDETAVPGGNPYTPLAGDFLMFSKYDQSAGDLIGYYAKVSFANNSREHAEIFSVGSEIIINSK
jgi:hypothetical protein